jgi:hypothetical protein
MYGISILVVLLGIFAIFANAEIAEKDFIPFYQCSFCLASVDRMVEKHISLPQACGELFPIDICQGLSFPDNFIADKKSSSRYMCRTLQKCPLQSTLPKDPKIMSSNGVDIRVAKAMGQRGYNKARVSVVSNSSIAANPLFDYSAPFKYRWTDKYLATGIVTLNPGATTNFNILGENVNIYLPKENEGVRGVIMADPCFQSEWIVCIYQNSFQTFDRLTGILNAIFAHEKDVHYWQILGDNFNDQQGAASSTWFQALSTATKSQFFATVPGNHDFWVNASPKLYVPKDQLGNGFMQFYGQDVVASLASSTPYDFVNDPDGINKGSENLPPASNFFFYNKIGNVAFIGYSGAHTFASMETSFADACTWINSVGADSVLILGHWNSNGDGCDATSATPAVYESIVSNVPQCSNLASKTRYFMGHKHCNIVTQADVGFMVGGLGMSDSTSCGGVFGVPIVDTTGGRFRVYYFPIQQAQGADNYDSIVNCIAANGASSCYHLAQLWTDVPL